MSQVKPGRLQQKQRTRDALLASARALLRAGGQPSLQDVADHAMISRATAYRYYSSSEALLSEAVLDGIAAQIGKFDPASTDSPTHPDDASLEQRIEALVCEVLEMVLNQETLFRAYLREVVASDGKTSRGARRLRWIDEAVGADAVGLPSATSARLRAALALLTGIEAVIVAKDIVGLDTAEVRDVLAWTARAIVRAALAEAASSPRDADAHR